MNLHYYLLVLIFMLSGNNGFAFYAGEMAKAATWDKQNLLPVAVYDSNPWILQKVKGDIQISTRHATHSVFNDVRVELDVPGNIEQLASILEDIPKYTEWAYATKKSQLIKKLGPGKLIYYSEIEVPWPATNRYYYASLELNPEPQNHSLNVVSVNIPDCGPVPEDLVKVPYCKGVWHVKATSSKSIHIDYTLELDPGGNLPVWMINLFTTKGPLETFELIKNKMKDLNPS